MQIKMIEPEQLPKVRTRLMQFFHAYGDKRITRQGMRWLKTVSPGELSAEKGTLILAAVEGNRLLGLLAIADFGRRESFVAVHRKQRRSGIGKRLLEELLKHVDKAYGRVALDNIPSLKMCLAMGMVAFKLVTGPTGKPTLWLGVGNWSKGDVE
ncbi:hypothetical protein BSNK01_25000 [Bacillaceae bacterium]